jgi:hypothetical protein
MNKRGFELVWNNFVIMILAIMLLLFLVLFFSFGSGNFFEQIKGYFSYSNVDSVVRNCNVLIDSGAEYGFCCEKREVKYYMDGNKAEGIFTCDELRKMEIGSKIHDFNCEEVSC